MTSFWGRQALPCLVFCSLWGGHQEIHAKCSDISGEAQVWISIQMFVECVRCMVNAKLLPVETDTLSSQSKNGKSKSHSRIFILGLNADICWHFWEWCQSVKHWELEVCTTWTAALEELLGTIRLFHWHCQNSHRWWFICYPQRWSLNLRIMSESWREASLMPYVSC